MNMMKSRSGKYRTKMAVQTDSCHRGFSVGRPRRTARSAVVLCILAPVLAMLGGCSIAMPVGGMFSNDDTLTTASIAPAQQVLSSEVTPEDWQFASMALGTAMDPLGTGTTSPWANPRTGIKGEFVAAGKPFVQNNRICRSFNATLNYQGGSEDLKGTACRVSGDNWQVTESRAAS